VILLGFGALTAANAARVAANLATPWAGLWERVNIGVFLIWIVVLAIVLLRQGKIGGLPNRTPVRSSA
jgi:ABC-type transport system involved in cytochrome c biogenesis permease subunit